MMKIPAYLRYLIACFALLSMLFMQLAVAAYTCPMATQSGQEMSVQHLVPVVMSNCAGMDNEMPVLCHVHAYGDAAGQSLDRTALPALAPFLPVQLGQLFSGAHLDQSIGNFQAVALDLTRRLFPPAAIRHCCFRI